MWLVIYLNYFRMFRFQECLYLLQFNCKWKTKFKDRQHTVDAKMKFVMLSADLPVMKEAEKTNGELTQTKILGYRRM